MISSFSVRPFTPADAPAWVAISNPVMGRQATAEALLAEDHGRNAAQQVNCRWVAEAGGQVVGVAHLFFFAFNSPGFLSAHVMVVPEQRGRGVGGAARLRAASAPLRLRTGPDRV